MFKFLKIKTVLSHVDKVFHFYSKRFAQHRFPEVSLRVTCPEQHHLQDVFLNFKTFLTNPIVPTCEKRSTAIFCGKTRRKSIFYVCAHEQLLSPWRHIPAFVATQATKSRKFSGKIYRMISRIFTALLYRREVNKRTYMFTGFI